MIKDKPHPVTSRRIALGTAQLGMTYGIANRSGRPSDVDVSGMIGAYIFAGYRWFDTATGYGESERVLGRVFAALGVQDDVHVVSKGVCGDGDHEGVWSQVTASLERLGLPRLAAWLLHDENQLVNWSDFHADEATRLRQEGLVESVGISVYHPAASLRAVEEFGFTSVQFPASPFDRRFLRLGVAERLVHGGAALNIRSIYLQGLGLMDVDTVPAGIPHAREAVHALSEFCREREFNRDQFCLHYVMQRTAAYGARLVVGMENHAQLDRNIDLLNAAPIEPRHLDEWDAIWPLDLEPLVLPYRWKK